MRVPQSRVWVREITGQCDDLLGKHDVCVRFLSFFCMYRQRSGTLVEATPGRCAAFGTHLGLAVPNRAETAEGRR